MLYSMQIAATSTAQLAVINAQTGEVYCTAESFAIAQSMVESMAACEYYDADELAIADLVEDSGIMTPHQIIA